MHGLWRILYLLYRNYSSLRYWAHRRFTRAGLAVAGTLAVAAMFGPDTDNNVTYQAFTLLLALVLVAMAYSVSFGGQFTALRRLPRFGSVGSPLRYHVRVRNATNKTQKGLVLLEGLAEFQASFEEWYAAQVSVQKPMRSFRLNPSLLRLHPFRVVAVKETELPPMRPDEEVEATVEVTPHRRGLLRFSRATLARPDPLGLFRAFVNISLPQTTLILPRRYPLPVLALPGAMKYQQGGVALAASVGQSEEFVALRDYRHGDPFRHIHWRSWARVGKPVVKEFEDEFFVRHALILDTFTRLEQGETFEEAVSVAASFATSVQTQESLLDLLFVGPQSYCFTAGRGLAHSDRMLEILASVQPCADKPFHTLEHLVLNHIKVVSGCICVLMAWDEPRRGFIEKVRSLGVPVLVLVVVGPGEGRAVDPGPMRDDPEQFLVLEAGEIEPALAKLK
jgi:uncharacterized protein (DUF58 family)